MVLVAGGNLAIEKIQEKAGFGPSSKWTHASGSLGGYNLIEATLPRSRLSDIQKTYIDKGYEIKVLRRKNQPQNQRYKVALWWATMNNLPYDILQFFWFPLSIVSGWITSRLHEAFSSKKRFLCTELIASGFNKEGDNLFNKSTENILPAEFDNPNLFDEIYDIYRKD